MLHFIIACAFYLSFWGIIGFTIVAIPIVQFLRYDFVIEQLTFLLLALSK